MGRLPDQRAACPRSGPRRTGERAEGVGAADVEHGLLVELYEKARKVKGVKHLFVGSGVRYDLAQADAKNGARYLKTLVQHHVSGQPKVAPEHVCEPVLKLMKKPGVASFERLRKDFERYSREAGKEQYLIPYFIAAHPGTTDTDMLELALWLKRNDFRLDQVQTFLPAPLALATAMYHTGHNPLKRVRRDSAPMSVPNGLRVRRLHKAFLRYHDPANWPLLREALVRMGRADLIGPGDPRPEVDAERLRLLLREIFTAAGGTHDDFDAYDKAMAAERRAAILVTPARTYHP